MFPSPNSKFKKRCVALDKDEEKKTKEDAPSSLPVLPINQQNRKLNVLILNEFKLCLS